MTGRMAVAEFAASTTGPLKQTEYLQLARRLRAAGGVADTSPLRVAILGTCTLDFLDPYILVEGAKAGWTVDPGFGGFGQLEQALLQSGTGLLDPPPDVLVLLVRPEDLDPGIAARPFTLGSPEGGDALTVAGDRAIECLRLFRQRSRSPVLIANFAPVAVAPLGPFEANTASSLTYRLAEANARLRTMVSAESNAYVWDYAGLVTAHGAAQWADPRLAMLARTPVAAQYQPALAGHLVRSIGGILRRPAKCLVLDLDNTLWGGVLGDDGLQGIQLGDDFPGNVFRSFQRTVRGLADRGVLLAVASKNDEDSVRRAFAEHPEMILREEDIAVFQCHWGPKSESMRVIAKVLNIGSDALVFFDDNPVERAEVRTNAPEVAVIEVPESPLEYAGTLLGSSLFDQPATSDEDRHRTALYRQERARTQQAEQFANLDDFLASLAMVASVGHADAGTLGRITQLIAKTNQFNLTTRRHTPGDVAALVADPRSAVLWLRLGDRFGDQGLVGVTVITTDGETATLDTLLMSCRVMGRRVEDAMLAYAGEVARGLGCHELVGEYVPTPKNTPVRDFYPDHGFSALPTRGDGLRYRVALGPEVLPWPAVIRRGEGVGSESPSQAGR